MTHPLSEDLDHILNHTKNLWEEVRNQNIFMTGGTGFFGIWLLESFLWANHHLDLNAKITILTRDPGKFLNRFPHLKEKKSLSFLQGDVRNFNFPEGHYSHIIHAATEASEKLNNETPLLMLDTIIEGTRRTLDFAVKCHAKKFLLTSSGAVYGKQPVDMTHIPESYQGAPDLSDPLSAYAQGKRMAEFLCSVYASMHLIECKIARGFAFVGPYLPLDTHFAIGNFIRDALGGGPIHIKGDGTPYRSYLYAADMAIWLWTILFKGENCQPYNVGSDDGKPLIEIAKITALTIEPPVPITVAKEIVPCSPIHHYIPSTVRARNHLGLKEIIDLPEAIRLTTVWNRAISN